MMKEASSYPTIAAVCGLTLTALAGTATCLATDATPNDSQPALQEIVVTATKRAENVQNVAAGVSVESGAQLVERGLAGLSDYAAYVPGLNVASAGTPGQTTVSIRGISSNTSTSAVGTYIDDTPIGSSSGWAQGASTLLDMLPYDLARLEVLRGPQGTLYGEGSMGGLIKYVLTTPSTTEFKANAGADTIFTDGTGKAGYVGRARVSLPLIPDVLGVSLSVFGQTTPGYVSNIFPGVAARDTNEDRQYGGRFAAFWQPASDLSVKFNALLSVIEADGAANHQYLGATRVPNAAGALIVSPTSPLPDDTESLAFLSRYDQHLAYTAATVDWNPGPVEFVSATSWSRQQSYTLGDATFGDGGLLPFFGGKTPALVNAIDPFGLDKVTQEFRLLSPTGGILEWLGGIFYTHESSRNAFYDQAFTSNYQPYPGFTFPPGLFDTTFPGDFQEYAAYGDLTWNVTGAFSITAGARHAKNDQQVRFFTLNTPFYPPPLVEYQPISFNEGVTTWMTDAKYHFTPDIMAYVRVATGYRPGGPNSPLPGIPLTVQSDSLINYEVGLKSTFLDHRAQVNFDVFHIDWNRIQLIAVSPINASSYLANGGKAVSNGVELQADLTPVRGLTLGLNAAYTDAHLTSVIAASNYLLTGYQLPNVPKESVSATADYSWTVMSGWTARVGGAYQYFGRQWLSLVESASSSASSPTAEIPGYSVFNFNASLGTDRLNYRLYVHNLANNRAIVNGGVGENLATNLSMPQDFRVSAVPLQPRTIGVGVDYAF